MVEGRPTVIVALDFSEYKETLDFVKKLNPKRCCIKVGSTLFTRCGPVLVEKLRELGFSVFLDLKFYDIPHQVRGACRVAASLGVWMLSLHLSGGGKMCRAAVEAVSTFPSPPILVGITVLTSFSEEDFSLLGMKDNIESTVIRYADLARQWGLGGIVCSPQELSSLVAVSKNNTKHSPFLYVTPGIRRVSMAGDDQTRVMSPQAAHKAGASYIVVGRDITQAEDPAAVLQAYSIAATS